ncbi:hypothetical protein COLO4_32656 [Corchorus olitorius]|uniref:Uncharacterized protein n=1 Tax=Corchorus olitorius TaxID=93759 RepID=A0A1R3GYR1_9ROSI|nr:hypothetical protein COLO4_32656 [Corchorus olitorius]
MQWSIKRQRLCPAPPSMTPPPPSELPHRLSREQEINVMVSALKNVINGSTTASATSSSSSSFAMDFPFHLGASGAAASSSTVTAGFNTNFGNMVLQPSEVMDKCHVCKHVDCLGCNLFPPSQQEEKKPSTSRNTIGKTKRETSSSLNLQQQSTERDTEMGFGTDFLDGMSDDDIQKWIEELGGDSSDSATTMGNAYSS